MFNFNFLGFMDIFANIALVSLSGVGVMMVSAILGSEKSYLNWQKTLIHNCLSYNNVMIG